MGNVASLELCKELYKLSGWKDTGRCYYSNAGEIGDVVYYTEEVFNKPGNLPAYDSGYLLRKLQLPHTTVLTGTIGGKSKRYSASYIPDEIGKYNIETMHFKANSPEDALVMLCISLFKKGVLEPSREEKSK